MIPVMICETYSFIWYFDAICDAPLLRKTMRAEISIIVKVLNLASQATMIAVNPRPPAVEVDMVWLAPDTATKPARPQMAPEMAMVLM